MLIFFALKSFSVNLEGKRDLKSQKTRSQENLSKGKFYYRRIWWKDIPK